MIRVAPLGFDPPYVAAMVELSAGPLVMGVVQGVDCDQAGTDLIGREVEVSGDIIPADRDASSRERARLVFNLLDN